MGLFGPPVLGELSFGFDATNSVCPVTDTVTAHNLEVPGYLLFPFMFASKLYFNFPPQSVHSVAKRAADRLSRQIDEDDPLAANVSLLGICADPGLTWAQSNAKCQWLYSCKFMGRGDSVPIPQTKFTSGPDEVLHRACIDAALDYARSKAPRLPGAVCLAAAGLHSGIAMTRQTDPQSFVRYGLMWAIQANRMIETGELP